jgi:hypothetical protein
MLKQLTVLFHNGFNNGAMLPEAPGADNTVNSLKEASELFRTWLRESGNDYVRGDGYGSPSATVWPTADYDGVAYGDYPYAMYELGPRGGVVKVSI